MIVTVTLNAALDVAYEAEGLAWQSTRDVSRVRHRAGGRGVAVARILHTFGHEVVAAGLAGGATGELIREDLSRSGIPVAFTAIEGESRRVLEVTDTTTGRMIRLREPGPYVTTEELGRFAGDYRRMLSDATAVVLCGTLPFGLPPEIYGSLATYAAEAGVPVILSAGGSALRHAALRRPDLIIPDARAMDADAPGGTGTSGGDEAAAGADVPGRAGVSGMVSAAGRAGVSGVAGVSGEAGAAGDVAAGALLRLGAAAVATPADGQVRVVTKAGTWTASLPTPGAREGQGTEEAPASLGALVAGLVPGFLLGWTWPDLLRHAVAVTAATNTSGKVNLAVYEGLFDGVTVEQAP